MKYLAVSVLAIFVMQQSFIKSMNTDDAVAQQILINEVEKILLLKKSELEVLHKQLSEAQTEQDRNEINQQIKNVEQRQDPMPPSMQN